ncbi:MAG: RNA polymerase sigma factor [Lewinellaceae bacterium]|nr:RNA polymerase sigma factor [Phaeodactylibacter sp.]MCB9039130.1 RNA polymerase sigma factor [Lewinellaceae bacterium]
MDVDFIKRLSKGDSEAIKSIFNGEIGNWIRNYVSRKGGTPENQEDTVTETILRVMKLINRGKYREEGKFPSFIRKVAKMVWKEEWKRQKKFSARIWLFTQSQLAKLEETSLSEKIENLAESIYLEACMKHLSERERAILKLHYYEGYSLSEIDELLSLKSNHTNVLIKRCREKLKRCINNAKKIQSAEKQN